METFEDIKKALSVVRAKTRYLPIRVKLNPFWAKQNLEKITVIKDNNTIGFSSIYGIPVEMDSSIETYEFIYREGEY